MGQGKALSPLNWAEKLIIATSAMTVTVVFTALAPMLPQIEKVFAHYAHASLLVKMLNGAIGASMVVGGPLGGWLARRFDYHRLLGVGYLIYAVAGAYGLFVSDLYMLLASRCIVGFMASATSTIVLIMLSDRANIDTRNFWLGIIVAVAMATGILSYPIAGYLGEMNWRFPCVMYLFAVPLAAMSLFLIRAGGGETSPASDGDSIGAPVSMGARLAALPHRLVTLAFLNGMIGFMPMTYVPYHLDRVGIADPRLISLSLMMAVLAGALSSGLYGRSRRILDIYQSLTVGYVLTAVGMVIVTSSSDVYVAMGGMFVFGCGLGWLEPNLGALVSRLSDQERASGFGLTKAAGYGASLVGILVLETGHITVGAHDVLLAVAGLGFLMMVWVLIDRGRFSEISPSPLASASG